MNQKLYEEIKSDSKPECVVNKIFHFSLNRVRHTVTCFHLSKMIKQKHDMGPSHEGLEVAHLSVNNT